MTIAQLYWLTRLDSLNCIFSMAIVICFIGLLACSAGWVMNQAENEGRELPVWTARIKFWVILLFSVAGVAALVPSQKEVFLIIGGAYATQNPDMQKIPTNAAKAVNQFLEQYMDKEDEKLKNNEAKP